MKNQRTKQPARTLRDLRTLAACCALVRMPMLTAALGMAALAGSVQAQSAAANLSGSVEDASGAAVVSAEVQVRNTGTNATRTVTVNQAGLFAAQNLTPGEYEVTVSAAGFRKEAETLTLNIGSEQVLTFKLTPGAQSDTVEVQGLSDTIQLGRSELGTTVGERTVKELPLNGRSWTDLAALQPGVSGITAVASYTGGAGRGNRGFGSQLTISGARPQQNNYRLDGVSINDYSNGGPGSVTGGNLGVDAIQEFSVLTSNYSAEYGKTSGGVINAVTKQGSNTLHGSVYEFIRNSALDTRNYFDPVGTKPSFRRNQFGAAAGGPIVRDRIFLFGDYEGVRQSTGISNLVLVPSANARQGIVTNGTTTTTVAVDPNSRRYLGFYPLPNGTVSGNTGQYFFASKQVANENFGTGRLDIPFSQKDTLFATYKYDRSDFAQPDNLNAVLIANATEAHTGVLEETHVFSSSLLNTARLGLNRSVADNNSTGTPVNPLSADSSLGALPGQNAAQLSIPGIAAFGGGVGGQAAYFFHFTSGQAYDDLFFTRGRHTMKMGVSFERIYSNILAITNGNGLFTFNTLSDFLTNTPRQFQIGFASSLSPRNLRQNIVGGYFQDDWHVMPNLTLNLGLRYEMATVPTEGHGKLSTLRTPTDAAPHLGDAYFNNPTYKNVEPRIGFNLDTRGNGKTVVSGGFGLFDVLPLTYQFNLLSSLTAPFFGSAVVNNPPKGSLPAGAAALTAASNSTAQAYIEPNPPRNYVMQYNLNVQQALGRDISLSVGYIGSRGVHQPFRSDDINIVLPTLTAQGYLWPTNPGTLMNPNFGDIRGLFWRSDSYYSGLQAQVKKSFTHGFQAQGSFTYSKSIDTSSSTIVGNAFANSINSPLAIDLARNRALSDFDVRRVLVVNALWQVPGTRSHNTLLEHVANGYELGGIFKASDGIPFNAFVAGDPLGLRSTSTFAFPDRLNTPGCESLTNPGNQRNYIKTQCFVRPASTRLLGNLKRNSLIGPGLQTIDLFLVKNTAIRSISENFNVQFRAEGFNVANRANFAAPLTNRNVFDASYVAIPTAGLIDSTTTTSRQLQFALKFIF